MVINRDFPVVELFTTRDIVAVKLDMAGRQVVVASEYLPPGDYVGTHMSLLQELVTKHEGLDVIILCDFNAKISVWEFRCIIPMSMVTSY